MIKSLSITNLRCFETAALNNLRRINVVVGRNAAGKTALLEAIRLAVGATPGVAWQIISVRGIPIFLQPNPNREQFEALWTAWFYDFRIDQKIEMTLTDSDGIKKAVSIYFDPDKAITPTLPLFPQTAPQTGSPTVVPIAFERKIEDQRSVLYGTIATGTASS